MKNILMLTTGGTIASVTTPYGLIPTLSSKELLSYLPKLEENINIETTMMASLSATVQTPWPIQPQPFHTLFKTPLSQ